MSTSDGNSPWSGMRTERADALSRLFKVAGHSQRHRINVNLLVRKTAAR